MNFADRSQTYTVNSGYREPDVLTDSTYADGNQDYLTAIGVASINAFETQLQNDFNEMAKSIAKYKGFYISRYEVGANGDSKKNQNVFTGSIYIKWYGLCHTLRNTTGNITKKHMIWRKSVRPNN